mmetsp:Transcript_126843/g.320388  ORF Transcript_126843/g.320388 Transcript_126843/m.320388 type:complete len:117 (+) Transcript_126843:771-1121(+)
MPVLARTGKILSPVWVRAEGCGRCYQGFVRLLRHFFPGILLFILHHFTATLVGVNCVKDSVPAPCRAQQQHHHQHRVHYDHIVFNQHKLFHYKLDKLNLHQHSDYNHNSLIDYNHD